MDVSGRADPSWQLATVVSIMLIFTAINSDVISTSNRRLQGMVLHASLTDPLTGLANRRRFREILDAHHSPDTRPLAVLMYDVDNFKQINENVATSPLTRCSSACATSCAPCCVMPTSWPDTAGTNWWCSPTFYPSKMPGRLVSAASYTSEPRPISD